MLFGICAILTMSAIAAALVWWGDQPIYHGQHEKEV